jgi:hypothetical protein
VKPLKYRLRKWFSTRPALRFGLAVAGPLFGEFAPEYFWPGVGVLTVGAMLHLWAKGCLRQNEVLTVCGPYRFVRHPFYLSYLVVDIGLCLMIAKLCVAAVYFLVWTVVYYFQIRSEERKLQELFGDRYSEYRRRVPALIPYGSHAPRAEGQSFSWKNPNLAHRSEIPRLIRLADFPLYFYLFYQLREIIHRPEMQFAQIGSLWNAFAVSLMLSLFFFSKLLSPAMRRKSRMLPKRLETPAVMAGVQLAVIAVALLLGTPEMWGSWLLTAAVVVAGCAAISALVRPLRRAYLPPILGSSAIALAWRMYWLAPIVAFYYGACAVDENLFPSKNQHTETGGA